MSKKVIIQKKYESDKTSEDNSHFCKIDSIDTSSHDYYYDIKPKRRQRDRIILSNSPQISDILKYLNLSLKK